MKKLISILLCAAMLASLSACANEDNGDVDKPDDTSAVTEASDEEEEEETEEVTEAPEDVTTIEPEETEAPETTVPETTTEEATTTEATTAEVTTVTTTEATTVTTTAEEISVEPMSAEMYANASVNVRKGPSTSYDRVGHLDEGEKVEVTGVCENGWYRIEFEGGEYYVGGSYLTDTKPEVVTTEATKAEEPENEPEDAKDSFEIAKEFMETVEDDLETYIPDKGYQDPASNGNANNIIKTTYYSDIAKQNKNVWIQLPYGYDESKEYPVLYVLHGIWCDETTMVNSWQTNDIIDNMTAEGLAEEMMVVYPMMYTDPDRLRPDGMQMVDTVPGYDAIVEDILCLMDYMSDNYSVAEGKDNTAVFGFSMGGREALAIGFTYPDKFGYVGAACPAPGLVPAQDWALNHPGQFRNDELKFTDEMPYLVLIGAGDKDGTVGSFPQSYHDLMVKNGVEHIFYIIPGSDHGDPAIASVTYNFCKYVFKAK